MKIAVASEGPDENADVCPTAGRAPWYLIFEDKKLVKSMRNPFARGSGGAGFGVAQMLANEGVTKVISGKFGQNMIQAMQEKGMEYTEIKGSTVKQAIEEVTK